MLTREAVYAMLKLRARGDNVFSKLPKELIQLISDFGQEPNSDIGKALHYAAYARQEDVKALLAMLDENPSLLLLAGKVTTPGGDEWKRVTIYEFLLGAGDYELAEKVQGYFSKIEQGEQKRIQQYEPYRPHIKDILTQEPYDLTPLINLITQASAEDVRALRNKDMTRKSELCKAIIQFQMDWAPQTLTKPGMHYNYSSLQHAFNTLDREWNNLYREGSNNYEKIGLVWQLLIGLEMRRLPGIDRCVMAQGIFSVMNEHEDVERSYKVKNSDRNFPVVVRDDPLDDFDGRFAVDILRSAVQEGRKLTALREAFWSLMSNKNFKLAELMRPRPACQPARCVLM